MVTSYLPLAQVKGLHHPEGTVVVIDNGYLEEGASVDDVSIWDDGTLESLRHSHVEGDHEEKVTTTTLQNKSSWALKKQVRTCTDVRTSAQESDFVVETHSSVRLEVVVTNETISRAAWVEELRVGQVFNEGPISTHQTTRRSLYEVFAATDQCSFIFDVSL